MAQEIDRAVAAAEALGARTGITVCDSDGRVLFRHRATETFAPASNMKLLTAAAVLHGLGADFVFVTKFELRGGRLVVTASGDPNWEFETAHDPSAVFAAVAHALRQGSVRTLSGIDLEAGDFTGPLRPATWPPDQLQTYYCAPTGPFVLDQGTFLLRLQSSGGAQANVELLSPRAGFPLRNGVDLVDGKKGVTYGAIDQGNAIAVRGKFPRKGSPVTIRTAVGDPATWYRSALQRALTEAGIALDAPTTVSDQVVYEHRTELRAALVRMLEDSSNFDAEQCLRVLGHHTRTDGSLAGGMQALQDQLRALIVTVPEAAVFADGSGLSKQNRVTPGLLVATMVSMQGSQAAMLRTCLPVAGQSGTLEGRFLGSELVGRVRAKTGWIRGASSLSGCVERVGGGVRWFSILMNYDPKQDGLNKNLKRLQEDIVRAIDRGVGQ